VTDTHRPAGDITHTTLSVLVLAVLIASTFLVMSPFLMPILWASVISIATWPLVLKLQAALGGKRGLAVAAMTALILIVVFVPVILALDTIISSAQGIGTEIRSLESIALPAPPSWVEGVPFVGRRIADEWRTIAALGPEERAAALSPYLQSALQWFVARAGSLGSMLFQFLLTTIITSIMLANGEIVRDGILSFADRLAGRHGPDVAALAARTIRGVVLGVVLTALIQAAIGGIGLVIAGIPAAALLSAVTLFLCMAQLGPWLVLGPAVAWLYWSEQSFAGTTLLVFMLISGLIDNVIRPILIRRGANLPLLLIFAGVIGGLIGFGIIGLFIGPVVLTVSYTLLKSWVSDAKAA
jgi:predicted PurR-regulated permease PerM